MKNDPAFPNLDTEITEYRDYEDGEEIYKEQVNVVQKGGLTKREYFAGLAMLGIASSGLAKDVERTAELSVTAADALITELEKEKV